MYKSEKDGTRALKKAQAALDEHGTSSGELHGIATEVNELAKKHKDMADEIREKSRKYTKAVRLAHEEAYRAVHEGWF